MAKTKPTTIEMVRMRLVSASRFIDPSRASFVVCKNLLAWESLVRRDRGPHIAAEGSTVACSIETCDPRFQGNSRERSERSPRNALHSPYQRIGGVCPLIQRVAGTPTSR